MLLFIFSWLSNNFYLVKEKTTLQLQKSTTIRQLKKSSQLSSSSQPDQHVADNVVEKLVNFELQNSKQKIRMAHEFFKRKNLFLLKTAQSTSARPPAPLVVQNWWFVKT